MSNVVKVSDYDFEVPQDQRNILAIACETIGLRDNPRHVSRLYGHDKNGTTFVKGLQVTIPFDRDTSAEHGIWALAIDKWFIGYRNRENTASSLVLLGFYEEMSQRPSIIYHLPTLATLILETMRPRLPPNTFSYTSEEIDRIHHVDVTYLQRRLTIDITFFPHVLYVAPDASQSYSIPTLIVGRI